MYFILLISLAFFLGVVGVSSNPSPCFGALSLVLASGFGSAVVAGVGDSFSGLILFLIYLGGMLVVFAYSVAMSSDLYPEVWHARFVGFSVFCCVVVMVLVFVPLFYGYGGFVTFGVERFGLCCVFDSGYFGVSLLYLVGGVSLLFVGFCLLLTLFVVLELVRGVSFGAYKV
uniref:NADH dehydrogenase subunit 6 n=1 Tax=Laudakia tuberculata TaxID=118215 RepID=UPI0030E36994